MLGSNDLSGSIPPEIGNLVNLVLLGLSYNDLVGVVPESMLNISPDAYVFLSGQTGCLTAVSPELQARLSAWDPDWNDSCHP